MLTKMPLFWLAGYLAALGCLVTFAVGDDRALDDSGPFAPAEALARFVLHPDCRIELVAAEPDVIDPVHIAFDPTGRMWVVEYSDYPHGPADGQPGQSRIRILTDNDHDGRYEQPVVFADKLLFATGVLPWKDGVIVTSAGAVHFMRDADGDGRADDIQEWFVGFQQENPQLRANHPTLGLDNHIYVASGLRGGEVGPGKDWAAAFARSDEAPPAPVSLSGRDFRFDPLTGDFESITGPGQFGLTFNDWGDRFVCDNRHPCRQVVFEDRDLRRNPKFAVSEVLTDVLPSGEASQLFPISRTWTTSNLHANQFTAACGLCLYRGDALPTAMHGNAFICDPTANLVHAAVVEPAGAVYTSHKQREGVEFLATRDEWFRPVNLTVGPDGALYVVDMYRAVIEHPQFMPEELKTRPDLLLGTDRGRIYRIVAKEPPQRPSPTLGGGQVLPLIDDPLGWARLLHYPNGWYRDTAHAVLLASESPEVGSLLEGQLNQIPAASVLALRMLLARGVLTAEQWLQALHNPDPHVQRQAVLIVKDIEFDRGTAAALIAEVGGQTTDQALKFACALTLPDLVEDPVELARYFRQLASGIELDIWTAQALATAPAESTVLLLADENGGAPSTISGPSLATLLEIAGAAATSEQLSAIIENYQNWTELSHLATGLRRGGHRFATVLPLLSEEPARIVTDWLNAAIRDAADTTKSPDIRLAAFGALSHQSWGQCGDTIQTLAAKELDPAVRAAALDVIAQHRSEDVGTVLVDDFAGMPPQVRSAAIRALTTTPARLKQLLDAVESGDIPPLLIDPATVKRITTTGDVELRDRAQALFASLTPESRSKVLAEYESCLTLDAEPGRGMAVFKAQCTTCHRIGELGVNVAPDISDSRTKTREYLLTSILDPNRAIDNNYFSYTVVDNEGLVHTGVLSTETSTSITLKQPEGKELTISRDRIDQLRSNGVSLMPEGLERNITPQQMADLISFIKNWRYLDGSVPREVIR